MLLQLQPAFMLNHGAHMFMATPKDDEESNVDECFLHDPPRHVESMGNVFTNLLTIGDLVFVTSDTLGKCVLDEIHLLDRHLVKMIHLEGLETFVGGVNVVQKLALGSCAVQTDIHLCHLIIVLESRRTFLI